MVPAWHFFPIGLLLTQPLKTNIFVGYINYCAIGNTDHKIILNMFSIIPNISESEGIKEKGHKRRGTLFEEYCFHCERALIRTVCVISKKDNYCKKNDTFAPMVMPLVWILFNRQLIIY